MTEKVIMNSQMLTFMKFRLLSGRSSVLTAVEVLGTSSRGGEDGRVERAHIPPWTVGRRRARGSQVSVVSSVTLG